MSIVFIEILLKNYIQLMKNSLLSNYKEKMVLLYMTELLAKKLLKSLKKLLTVSEGHAIMYIEGNGNVTNKN